MRYWTEQGLLKSSSSPSRHRLTAPAQLCRADQATFQSHLQCQFATLTIWNSLGDKKTKPIPSTRQMPNTLSADIHTTPPWYRDSFPSFIYPPAWRSLWSSLLRVRRFLNGQQVLPDLCCYLVFSLALCQRKVFKAYVKKWCSRWCEARPWAVLNPSYVCGLPQSYANSYRLCSCPIWIMFYPLIW